MGVRARLAVVALVTLGAVTSSRSGERVAAATPTASSLACTEAVVTHWTLPALAAQVVVVPVNVAALSSVASAAGLGYGGIILFGATAPAGFAAALARVQAQSPVGLPLMVMTDDEGGGVQRLTNLVPSMPWAQVMGRTMSAAQITAVATRTAIALRRVGVNVDLAPVLDVDGRAVYPGAANPDGLRSFGGSPSRVATDGLAFANGLIAGGVTPVIKHFPGLGGASANTDYGPASTRAWSVLQTSGLVPFQRAIAAGVPAVMLSNATVPGLSALPASVSPAVVNVLRTRLGFTGLIMTDSLSAGAISAAHLSVPAAALAALRAGADQVLFSIPRAPATSLTLAAQVARGLVAAVVKGQLARPVLVAAASQVLLARGYVCAPPSTTSTTGLTATS